MIESSDLFLQVLPDPAAGNLHFPIQDGLSLELSCSLNFQIRAGFLSFKFLQAKVFAKKQFVIMPHLSFSVDIIPENN